MNDGFDPDALDHAVEAAELRLNGPSDAAANGDAESAQALDPDSSARANAPTGSTRSNKPRPKVAQRINKAPSLLPWSAPVDSALAGFFMFPLAIVPALMPFLMHKGALDIIAGLVGSALLVATGAHLLWEVIAFGKFQDDESWKSDPKRPLVYGRLPLGVKLRWLAIDAALFGSAFLIPWLIRSLGHWAQGA